ncbi:hypothetical protein FXO38_36611, partial [Capsicum annuum]
MELLISEAVGFLHKWSLHKGSVGSLSWILVVACEGCECVSKWFNEDGLSVMRSQLQFPIETNISLGGQSYLELPGTCCWSGCAQASLDTKVIKIKTTYNGTDKGMLPFAFSTRKQKRATYLEEAADNSYRG